MTLKVPKGWDVLEVRRRTPHGEFEVNVYADGQILADLWRDGNASPIGGEYAFPGDAIKRCNLELKALSTAAYAECGAEDVDANGAPV
jgi:hypothetical protein